MKNFFLLFSFVTSFSFAQTSVQVSGEPAWIAAISPDLKNTIIPENSGGSYYLLIDIQDQIQKQQRYIHYAVKVLNNEGIQEVSDISTFFDPGYQQLTFHKVLVHRNGKVIDKLKDHNIHTYQRETSMDRHMYDGSLTAVINLTDIRVGDVIEYSYSRTGYNPIYDGKYFERFYTEYTVPVERIRCSIITEKGRKLYFKYYNDLEKPQVVTTGDNLTYTWDEKKVPAVLYDNNVPAWYDAQKSVAVSEFDSWYKLAEWFLPLYQLSDSDIKIIEEKTNDIRRITDKEYQINQAIELVQDDVRYLGFESGLSAHKPNKPDLVLERRFGDCKDKSLLLVAVLRTIGIEAYPMLVNSSRTAAIKADLPSPDSFDHCVVSYNYKGKEVYVDPTINNQGGNWKRRSFPNYKFGLTLKKGAKELTILPLPESSKTIVKELITADDFEKPATVLVRTEYYGDRADYQRSYFKNNSLETINKEYLNYYSSIYPNIKSTKEIKFYDYDRESYNKVIVEEEYEVPDFWKTSEDNDQIVYGEIYSLEMESLVNVANSSERSMPYYVGMPTTFDQEIIVELPDEWTVNTPDLNVESTAFKYFSKTTSDGKSVKVSHHYQTFQDFVSAQEASDFIAKHEKIKNNLSLVLSQDKSVSGFKLSWLSVVIVFICFILGIYFARKVYNTYDPTPGLSMESYDQIGGWLVLVAIGLVLTPFKVGFDLFSTTEFFNQNIWTSLLRFDAAKKMSIAYLLLFELIYNSLFLVYSVLVVVVFFQRRTCAPKLIMIFYLVNVVVVILDTSMSLTLMPNAYTSAEQTSSYTTIGRSIISALIWIPYFNVSTRVKATFTVKKNPYANTEPVVVSDDATI